MGVWQFFVSVWHSYLNDLSLAEQCLAALPFIAYFFGIIAAVRQHYKGKAKGLSRQLEDEKNAAVQLLKKYNDLEEDYAAISKTLPENWQAVVERERKDGNEARALGFLRDELKTLSAPLTKAADELANYHASVAFDLDGSHLQEAKRYCRIAILHGGSSLVRERLLDEIDAIQALNKNEGQADFSDWSDLHAAFSVGDDSVAIVEQLNSSALKTIADGHYHIAEALVLRGLLIVERNDLLRHEVGFRTRSLKASILHSLGRYAEVLAEIEAYAPLQEKLLSTDHRDVLTTRFLNAEALNRLGRNMEVLAEIEAFAPLQVKALSASHPDVFSTLNLKAEALDRLGRHLEALAEIEAYAPSQEKLLSPDHPHVLTTRLLKAEVVCHLGRHLEALAEIEAYAPLQVKALSPDHPQVLLTRSLKTKVLDSLGRHYEALAEIEAYAPLQVKALSPDHPQVLWTRRAKTRLLDKLGRHSEALAEIKAYAPLQVQTLTSKHPDVIKTEKLRRELTVKIESP